MTMTPEESILSAAQVAGAQSGRDAWCWASQDMFGGRSVGDVRPLAEKVLKGLEDGDPEILDLLPSLDLSGQWADGPSVSGILMLVEDILRGVIVFKLNGALALFRERLAADHASGYDDDWSDVIDAYELGYNQAVQDEAYRSCEDILAGRDGEDD